MSAAVPHTRIHDPEPAAMMSLLGGDGGWNESETLSAPAVLVTLKMG